MRRLVIACGICLGCRGTSRDPVITSHVPPDPAARRAEAGALVLGAGGVRDYRKAARIYSDLCGDGCGDIAACRELFDLAIHERGLVMTAALLPIPARLCDRGDQVGCWVAGLYNVRDPHRFTGDLDALCAGGDRKACLASVTVDFGQIPGPVLARPVPLASCNGGAADGCESLFAAMWAMCSARDIAPGAACVDDRAREWTESGGDATPLLEAWRHVQASCAAGEPIACDWVPGHELDARSLCRAGDFHRCAQLARNGDDSAGALACAGGVTEACTPSRPRPALSNLKPTISACAP